MFRRAGLIVGIVIFLLACIIFWYAGKLEKSNNPSEQETGQYEVESKTDIKKQEPQDLTQPTPTEEIPQVQQQPTNIQNQEQVTPSVEEQETSNQAFQVMDKTDIGEPKTKRTEVMVISNKNVMLLDNDTQTHEGKQLTYQVELMYNGDKRMVLPINGVVYDELKVGGKLKVEYELYENDNGVEFPLIMSAEQVE